MTDERIKAAISRLAYECEQANWQSAFAEAHTLMGVLLQRAFTDEPVAEGPSPELGAALAMIKEATTVDALKGVATRLKAIGLEGRDRDHALGIYSERMQTLTERVLAAPGAPAKAPTHTETPAAPVQANLGLSDEPPPPSDDDAPR